ncbi:DUF2783 domain-containing protein [Paraburkholderia bonniea]|uniref:DUF2783 domain-containing protein n=1 Tax=Paraburkholderia bonniea TaxID=2152891 RepID=UPI00129273FE|nr:DUF2783 domain-containing protein [Paraburkholderia bonniea]WJF92107.1 DUF2783 domain-containing protein [Paraburkholderia bonniea]WJF95427.1 DUF2783 domain-containing protein [Paraburkholderia bonniea]
MPMLKDEERDALYSACCMAISEVGRERESLLLARLVLLLFEALGDAARCEAALSAARDAVPVPSLSRH